MAFLHPKSSFPPTDWEYWYMKYDEWASWYSGDPEILLKYYTMYASGNKTAQERFWARLESEDRAGIVHMPAAGDIASTSANLLFAENPRHKYEEKNESGQRIKTFIDENGLDNILLEGAEIAAAISGCMLKIDIEPGLLKIPIVNIISPTQFFPTFWRGRLQEVLFFRVIKTDKSGKIYRLFENRRNENGVLLIEYQLHKGTNSTVGPKIDFNLIDETANKNLNPVEYPNIDGLGCVYCPNMRPNRLSIGSYLGINDYHDVITMMDSLDFAWTSLMRDIELGMAQIFIDEELLSKNKNETSGGLTYLNRFSKFQKAFTKLNLTSWRMGGETGAKPIDSIQFEIRVDQHLKTIKELFLNIVSLSGYSPQTFGLGDAGSAAESGAARKLRENKSQLTRNKKERYWLPVIKSLFKQMQQLDVSSNLSRSYTSQDVTTELEDSIVIDPREQSEVLRNLDQARAISLYMKIKLLHPDWSDKKIKDEVDKINKESGITGEII
jgi:hypothetical protein